LHASDAHAQIRRINLDGSGMEVVARASGRSSDGLHPVSKQLYFHRDSRDWLSEDVPNDKLNRLAIRARTISASRIVTRAILPTRNSAGVAPVTSSPSRSR